MDFDSPLTPTWTSHLKNVSATDYSYIEINATVLKQTFGHLSQWQKAQLQRVKAQGVLCLLKSWFLLAQDPIEGPYCNGTWDDIFCWPPTLPGVQVSAPCYEVMKNDEEIDINSMNVTGDAYRICAADGTWLWGNWTNYNQCAENFAHKPLGNVTDEHQHIRTAATYILFLGSILSLVCLSASLLIFYYFKSLRCDRITVHVHLMVALTLRAFLYIIISEPFIFNRTNNYRTVDWCCKLVLALQFYALVASVNWMFVQGHYLHSRLTTNIFDRGLPIKRYAALGWGAPLILVSAWSIVMEIEHPVHCWKNYGELPYNWIIVGPMLFVLLINLGFLGNIMRILLFKIQLTSNATESEQVRRAVKATVVLFPLLGVNNLVFFYNPGGTGEIYYMLTNTILQSSQGIFVSFLYCFICKDVREASKRFWGRIAARRSAASLRAGHSQQSCKEKPSNRISVNRATQEGVSVAYYSNKREEQRNASVKEGHQDPQQDNTKRNGGSHLGSTDHPRESVIISLEPLSPSHSSNRTPLDGSPMHGEQTCLLTPKGKWRRRDKTGSGGGASKQGRLGNKDDKNEDTVGSVASASGSLEVKQGVNGTRRVETDIF